MRKKILVCSTFLLLLTLGFKNNQNQNDLWIQDFEVLKAQMTKSYANLKSIVNEESIDLARLNTKTISELKLAKTKREAQIVIESFLRKFKDGHLSATVINTSSSNNTSNERNDFPLSTDSTAVALKKMGFFIDTYGANIKFDSVPGYLALINKNNSFHTAVIETSLGKIGTIKLPYFYNEGYWNTPYKMWDSYKKEFKGECDEECQKNFKYKLEKQFTKQFVERIEELKAKNISKLLIDVTGNNGGSGWFEEIAHLLSDKPKLEYMPSFIIKHNHWKKSLEEDLKIIGIDLANDELNESLKLKLLKLKELAESLIVKCKSNCSSQNVWDSNKIDCLKLIRHPYQSDLPFDIMTDSQFMLLQSKNLLTASRFRPFKRGAYSGPLYIVQDRQSASATEGFSSLLQFNNAATIVGRTSYGAGCGYTNGGIKTTLNHIGLSIKMPDCVRLRADGKNEVYGIKPDIKVNWRRISDSPSKKGQLVIESIIR